jgi:transcriptional regulator GlxA family with amidase domain
VRADRVVDSGRVVTAGGVACALDLGLHLVGKHWGDEARARIGRQMRLLP